jgi:hypothetical protein
LEDRVNRRELSLLLEQVDPHAEVMPGRGPRGRARGPARGGSYEQHPDRRHRCFECNRPRLQKGVCDFCLEQDRLRQGAVDPELDTFVGQGLP